MQIVKHYIKIKQNRWQSLIKTCQYENKSENIDSSDDISSSG